MLNLIHDLKLDRLMPFVMNSEGLNQLSFKPPFLGMFYTCTFSTFMFLTLGLN
jgi:hypothetical protein